MWFCFNDGFLSVVADKHDPARLLVRARRKKDLLNVFGPHIEIVKNAGTDYRWRTFVDRKMFAALVASRIESIDYPNFKNSVPDRDLHDLYMDFWNLHHRYQSHDETERPPANRKPN
jgi:hypothetical protein